MAADIAMTQTNLPIITNADRAFTLQAYFASDLFLFPSRVECSPIVLFEACAAGVPFIATDVGNAREISDWLECGQIMTTTKNRLKYSKVSVKEAAAELTGFAIDKKSLSKSGEIGRKRWVENYTWEEIAQKYESTFIKLIACQ